MSEFVPDFLAYNRFRIPTIVARPYFPLTNLNFFAVTLYRATIVRVDHILRYNVYVLNMHNLVCIDVLSRMSSITVGKGITNKCISQDSPDFCFLVCVAFNM